MPNPIMSKCSKVAQKDNKSRHDWVRKVIHRELCKKLKLGHADKQYMDKPESVVKNEIHKEFFRNLRYKHIH